MTPAVACTASIQKMMDSVFSVRVRNFIRAIEVRSGGYEVLAGRIRVPRRSRAMLVACAAFDRLFAARTAGW